MLTEIISIWWFLYSSFCRSVFSEWISVKLNGRKQRKLLFFIAPEKSPLTSELQNLHLSSLELCKTCVALCHHKKISGTSLDHFPTTNYLPWKPSLLTHLSPDVPGPSELVIVVFPSMFLELLIESCKESLPW